VPRRSRALTRSLSGFAPWAWLVTLGEIAVGVGLILGCLTGIAAFFGGFMNVNYLLAGTVSSNPILFVFATWLVLAWRVAGWYGIDRWLLPLLGTPWWPGQLVRREQILSESEEPTSIRTPIGAGAPGPDVTRGD
jgi:hypothetical protein